jgi:hypothetical protein
MTEHAPVGTKVRLAKTIRSGDEPLPRWLPCTVASERYDGGCNLGEVVDLRVAEGPNMGERIILIRADEYVLDADPLTYSGDPEWPFRHGWGAHAAASRLVAAGFFARPECRPFRRDETGEVDEAWRVSITLTADLHWTPVDLAVPVPTA